VKKAFAWIAVLSLVGLTIIIAVWLCLVPCARCILTPNTYHRDPGPGQERSSSTSLKSLSSAEADFRANDRDGNGVKDFWRKDVAGFYAAPGADGRPMKLIELSVACADDRPVTDLSAFGIRSPKVGYWYRALRHEDEDPRHLDPQRFAFAAIPVLFPRHQKYVFIIDEENTMYRSADPANFNIEVFPKDLRNWSKMD
jgi:hypothetical protein